MPQCTMVFIMMLFIKKGHDTSAMGLCFALLLIAEHKDVQVVIYLA